MSQKKGKQGSILDYLKAAPPVAPKAPKAPKSPSPLPPSSPLGITDTPSKPTRGPLNNTIEIRASDEESDAGESSDSSLADLSVLIGRSRPGNASSASGARDGSYATPRAKRTAVEFHSSPLAFMPKHKYDLKALAKDARQDDATNASSRRVHAAHDSDQDMELAAEGVADDALADIVKESAGQDAQKVLRAVKRAEGGNSLLWYCFFEPESRTPSPAAIPKRAAKGPWRLLTEGNVRTREQHLVSGLPHTILAKNGGLPDELFQWILDEICTQGSPIMRQEYCNLIMQCSQQVHELVTPQKLEEALLRLGADDDIRNTTTELVVSRPAQDPYKDRDWSCLESFLGLLGMIAEHLAVVSVTYAAQMLLRMSMDRFLILNTNMLSVYEATIVSLLGAIPQPSWDGFCFEICTRLHANIKIQCIRTNALLCLPVSDPRAHELRRKLAITFLFEDPSASRPSSGNPITLRRLTDRLLQDDFAVNVKTDFAELKARVIQLDVCIDDGSHSASDDPSDEKMFNEQVDELATALRDIWRKINDAGMKLARTEAKSVIEWVQQRLTHSVRTKRKAKRSIFDLPGQKADPFLPRQQDFMKRFVKKVSEAETTE
ncbi:hypothetical protein B0I35DRAFT_354212 [Stachybotrys elegans]|uniref:Uncharacterized protein n=1 Tax=Stachybotrys elegans TaxID=80388 RepID=A0A8K0WPG3_9HYPO|nr:hypothetical protein B0I35DRAFT_354212 [Stachybotrys elegans]